MKSLKNPYRRVIENGVRRIIGPALDVTEQHAHDFIVGMMDMAYGAGRDGVEHPQHYHLNQKRLCEIKGERRPAPLMADLGVTCKRCLSRSPAPPDAKEDAA